MFTIKKTDTPFGQAVHATVVNMLLNVGADYATEMFEEMAYGDKTSEQLLQFEQMMKDRPFSSAWNLGLLDYWCTKHNLDIDMVLIAAVKLMSHNRFPDLETAQSIYDVLVDSHQKMINDFIELGIVKNLEYASMHMSDEARGSIDLGEPGNPPTPKFHINVSLLGAVPENFKVVDDVLMVGTPCCEGCCTCGKGI